MARDGEQLWAESSETPANGAKSALAGALTYGSDVTRIRLLRRDRPAKRV